MVRSKQQSGSSGKRGLNWNSKELGSDPGSAHSFTLPCHFLGGKSAPDLRSPSRWACSCWEAVPCTPSTFSQSLPAPGPACSKGKHRNISTGPILWCWPNAGPPIRNRKSGQNADTGPGSRRRAPPRFGAGSLQGKLRASWGGEWLWPDKRAPWLPRMGRGRARCQGSGRCDEDMHAEVLC